MVAPRDPLMKPRHLLLRVFSVKQDRGDLESRPVVPASDPIPPTWEVRADADAGLGKASLFYHEDNPHNLPPLDSLIHIVVDGELTTTNAVPPSTPTGE